MSMHEILTKLDSLESLPQHVKDLVDKLSTDNTIDEEFRTDLEDLLRCSVGLSSLYIQEYHDAREATRLLGELLGIIARLQVYSTENKPERTAWGFVNTKTRVIHNYVYATEEAALADLDDLEQIFQTPGVLRVIPVNVTSNVAAMPKVEPAPRAVIPGPATPAPKSITAPAANAGTVAPEPKLAPPAGNADPTAPATIPVPTTPPPTQLPEG